MSNYRRVGLGFAILVGLLSLLDHLWFSALSMAVLVIAQTADYVRMRRAGRKQHE